MVLNPEIETHLIPHADVLLDCMGDLAPVKFA